MVELTAKCIYVKIESYKPFIQQYIILLYTQKIFTIGITIKKIKTIDI